MKQIFWPVKKRHQLTLTIEYLWNELGALQERFDGEHSKTITDMRDKLLSSEAENEDLRKRLGTITELSDKYENLKEERDTEAELNHVLDEEISSERNKRSALEDLT